MQTNVIDVDQISGITFEILATFLPWRCSSRRISDYRVEHSTRLLGGSAFKPRRRLILPLNIIEDAVILSVWSEFDLASVCPTPTTKLLNEFVKLKSGHPVKGLTSIWRHQIVHMPSIILSHWLVSNTGPPNRFGWEYRLQHANHSPTEVALGTRDRIANI